MSDASTNNLNLNNLVNIHQLCLSAARINIFLYHTKFEINKGISVSRTWFQKELIRVIECNDGSIDKIPEFWKIFDQISPKSEEDAIKQEQLEGLMMDLMLYSHQVYRNMKIPIKQFHNGLIEIISSLDNRL